MRTRSGFAALLAVVGISIVFGMVVGAKLNAPQVMHAAPQAAAAGTFLGAPPKDSVYPTTVVDFAAIVEKASPAVVAVTNTAVSKAGKGGSQDESEGDDDGSGGAPDEDLFRFFFGPDDPHRNLPRNRQTPPRRQVSGGSGFVVSKDGYIMTNNHVVENATKLVVTLEDGVKYDAELVGTDPLIDLALIKIDPKGKDLPVLPLGDSDKLRVGEWVMAVGNPLEFEHSVTVGVVSGKKRQIQIGETIPGIANFIQTDAAINFGNSGGPLLNTRGEVVGINTAIYRGGGPFQSAMVEGISFAVAINEARRAAEQLRQGGSVKRGYLGINMNQTGVNDAAKEYYGLPDSNGVIINSVVEDGPGAKGGLRAGDVIRRINGATIRDNQDLLSKVASLQPGDDAKVEVFRDGKTVDLKVVLGERPTRITDDRRPGGRSPGRPGQDDESAAQAEGLGIKVEALTPRLRQQMRLEPDVQGVVVTEIDPESAAADVDRLVPNRLILSVNREKVSKPADWARLTHELKPGTAVAIELWAGEQSETVFMKVAEPRKK